MGTHARLRPPLPSGTSSVPSGPSPPLESAGGSAGPIFHATGNCTPCEIFRTSPASLTPSGQFCKPRFHVSTEHYNSDWAVLAEMDGTERLYFVVESRSGLYDGGLLAHRYRRSFQPSRSNAHTSSVRIVRSFNSSDVADWPIVNRPCSRYSWPSSVRTVMTRSIGSTIQYSAMPALA